MIGGLLGIPVEIGVHTGISSIGYIGEEDALDFTAVGDAVNTAASRTLELRGREQSVDAWIQPAMSSVARTAA